MKSAVVQDVLAQAVEHHRAGRLTQAREIYRKVLEVHPRHPDALHLSGMIAKQEGRLAEAIELMKRALEHSAPTAHYYGNLADALSEAGKQREAVDMYRRAIDLKPAPELHNNLGLALAACGDRGAAVTAYRESLRVRPGHAGTLTNLAAVLIDAGRLKEAVQTAEQASAAEGAGAPALAVLAAARLASGNVTGAADAAMKAVFADPANAAANAYLGAALCGLRRFTDAIAPLTRAVQLRPSDSASWRWLGTVFSDAGRHEEAAAAAARAAELSPKSAAAADLLGAILVRAGREDDAVLHLRRSIELGGGADAHHHLGIALEHQGLWDAAIAEYDAALKIAPGHDAAKLYRAMLMLSRGDFARGWSEYEARIPWAAKRGFKRTFDAPRWTAASPAGRTVLLWAEQGFGDAIQFIRYARMVAERGNTVLVECDRALATLFRRAAGVSGVIAAGETVPKHDAQCPLMSLPLALGTTPADIPAAVPYLQADLVQSASWHARLGDLPGKRHALRVGLVWAGRPAHHNDANRSMPFEMLEPLVGVEGVEFHSLQKGPAAAVAREHMGWLHPVDHESDLTDFDHTAALIDCMDIVLSVDTAVAHLAGAMGKTAWVMLPAVAEWRWNLAEDRSPWYPSMRLFRQTRRGDWAGVVDRVREELVKAELASR